ncbi:MAG: hypothetical protein EBS42_13565, partial [Caulobacteraceae bacterium]|nr:hypothetical protein [Caulobacteraceae bacterium]
MPVAPCNGDATGCGRESVWRSPSATIERPGPAAPIRIGRCRHAAGSSSGVASLPSISTDLPSDFPEARQSIQATLYLWPASSSASRAMAASISGARSYRTRYQA